VCLVQEKEAGSQPAAPAADYQPLLSPHPTRHSEGRRKKQKKQVFELNCLCQQPYDEKRDMIGCSSDGMCVAWDDDKVDVKWFHPECVGLSSVGDVPAKLA
jgi:hypothetical protein